MIVKWNANVMHTETENLYSLSYYNLLSTLVSFFVIDKVIGQVNASAMKGFETVLCLHDFSADGQCCNLMLNL